MVDYKKYIAVLELLKNQTDDDHTLASAICELFDEKNQERTEDRMTEEEWKRNIINMLG